MIPKSGKLDRFLSKLQQFAMDAVGPLTLLYEQLEREGESSATVDTSKSAIQASLSFLGNVAAHFSVERRKALIKYLNKDLKHLAEALLSEDLSCLVRTLEKEPKPQLTISLSQH